MTASLTLPCSSLAMRSASSIRSVPKPFRAPQQRETRRVNVRIPDAGTSLGLFRALVQRCRIHGAPARCSCHHLPHLFEQVLGGMSPLRSISLAEAVRRGYLAQDPRRKGRFPNHRSRYSLAVVTRSILVELCGGSRVSARRVRPCHSKLETK